MTLEKAVGILCGLSGLLLMFFFAWYLMWDARAENHIDAIKQSIARQEALWSQHGQSVSLQYEDIFATGFPFHTKVRLLRPQFRAAVNGERMLIHTTYLDFDPETGDIWQYELEFLPDFSVVYGQNDQKTDYYVHLHALPRLLVHAPPEEDIAISKTNEYGVILPPQLMMSIQRNEISRKIAFQYISSSEPLWRYVPQNVHHSLEMLLSLLQEATGPR